MRGKPHTVRNQNGSGGNIPAYAGKTQQHDVALALLTEHPRVCGENHRTLTPPW